MKFIPTPKPATDDNLILEFKEFSRTLRIKDYFNETSNKEDYNPKFHVKSGWTPKATAMSAPLNQALDSMDKQFMQMLATSRHSHTSSNLTKEQRFAIKSIKALRELQDNVTLEMRMADKNLGSVLLNKEQDLALLKAHLDDRTTYAVIQFIPMSAMKKRLSIIIDMFDADTESQLVKFLKTSGENIPKYKILIKLHKDPISARPIIPGIGTITTNLSVLSMGCHRSATTD